MGAMRSALIGGVRDLGDGAMRDVRGAHSVQGLAAPVGGGAAAPEGSRPELEGGPQPSAVASVAPASIGAGTTRVEAPDATPARVDLPERAAMPVGRWLLAGISTVLVIGGGLASRGGCGKGLGAEARTAGECRSGTILTSGLRGICTCACEYGRECPGDFSCFEGHCIPAGTKGEGEACAAPWDCRSHRCGSTIFSEVLHARLTNDPLSQGPTQCLP
jgi:hypothetical protein